MSDDDLGLEIRDVAGFVDLASALRDEWGGRSWWRGESDQFPTPLVPKVLRDGRWSQTDEASMMMTFMMQARSRRSDLPTEEDRAGWMFLMQHYGLPTRLLDWSDSLLVGLHFAAQDDSRQGVLWAMKPTGLNSAQGFGQRLALSAHPEVAKLVGVAFSGTGSSEKVLALLPPEIDLRAMLQAGRCTIHGSVPLLDIKEAQVHIRRIAIPADAKPKIRQQLRLLGVDKSRLFPDLASLAADISGFTFGPD